ncbi:DUF1192 domain-containing protein [Novosphingobium aerophilum]|uniref:DUF1192 domain-containing protein n=1 Tax=Novosphingobium TaxID=165696 RepID=UPI0006C848A4|nr:MULTISPECIES: DUF1192 domain-containing protein [unclassified Novosphingobium]KPH57420.1 hypothetical protein ADT71_27955 [Novosphingobium sp. ST904]MPS67418.1 DUF1192 domain-containing protein [Novosphingobium sp.]TCM42953.1 uncharacterized small protein (DUF1192 family) [Novosphingobium sp. ST904]WRT93311.1 DUF1192 domain-containing protein [Novosphingobium sp. RL4]
MDDDDRPRRWSSENNPGRAELGAASLLASESLDRFSLDELDARVTLLEAEIERIKAHRQKSAAHMRAADALFRPKQS